MKLRLACRVKRVEDARHLLSTVLGQIRDELAALTSAEAASGGGTSRQQQKDKFARVANQHGKRLATATAAFNKANKKTTPPTNAGAGAAAAKLPSSGGAADTGDEEAGLLGGTAESAQAMVDATATSLIREREQEAAEIAREMTEVADIMKDIAELTEEQNDGFVKLESNAAAAEAAAMAGNKHLDSAAKQQAAYRRKVSEKPTTHAAVAESSWQRCHWLQNPRMCLCRSSSCSWRSLF